jgi:6-phosphofructokinase 1
MQRIGILTSGGDAPGMNACIRAAMRAAAATGVEIYGIQHGYTGLIDGDIILMDRRFVFNIIHQGGTVLGTARSDEFMTEAGRARAAEVLRVAGISGLIVIGGDGSFRGGNDLFNEHGINVVGVPATIDNDISGTDYSIGFDTAVNTALAAIDRIRDTAMSHERLFFVEVMGRHSGFIAVACGIAGGAESLIIPEIPTDAEALCLNLQESFGREKRSAIVVVAEGEQQGDSFRIAREVKEISGLDSKVCILGHIQRGGSPTARDRMLASKMGVLAVQTLVAGEEEGVVVGEIKGEMALTSIKKSTATKKEMSNQLMALVELLSE